MKSRFVSAMAIAFALGQLAAPAYAQQAPAQYRTAAPQTFTAQDLQAYGLNAAQAERGVELQSQGYEVRVLTPEEAAQYQAGITDNQWLLIGILVGVVVIAVTLN